MNEVKEVMYRGCAITHNFYGLDEFSVQYEGDDVMFEYMGDAMLFIDSVINGEVRCADD